MAGFSSDPRAVETSTVDGQSNEKGVEVGAVYMDYDSTMTLRSSVSLQLKTIIHAAAETGRHSAQSIEERNSTTVKLAEQIEVEQEALCDRMLKDETSSDLESRLSDIDQALAGFGDKWNRIIEETGVLQDASREAFLDKADRTELAEGCLDFIARCIDRKIPLIVVSINWSADWIRQSLVTRSNLVRSTVDNSDPMFSIHANELEYRDGLSSGKLIKKLQSGKDKTALMRSLIEESHPKGIAIFVGDSVNDLGAMLTADVGIVLGRDKMLRSMIERLGLRIRSVKTSSLSDAVHGSRSVDGGTDNARCLFVADGWKDVDRFLFGVPRGVPRVLIVAGSDSGGGAGIQADLKTCMATGSFATTAIAAITSQNTFGVQSIHTVPSDHLRSQLDSILSDIGTDVVKVGMLSSVEAVEILQEKLKEFGKPPLVVDPVLVSTSGHTLSSNAVASSIVKYLFPMATIVCPNIPEAAVIADLRIVDVTDMKAAAKKIKGMGPELVLIKGGHLRQDIIEDVLYDGEAFHIVRHPRVETDRLHGTGCTLASAVASGLAQGMQPIEAVRFGVRYLDQALRNSISMTIGSGKQLPFHHGYRWHSWPKQPSKKFDPRLYGITDRGFDRKHGRNFVRSVREAVEGGVTVLQIREKDVDAVTFLERAKTATEVSGSIPVIVNDRVDVAMAVDADGVHVGQEDLPAASVRSMIGPEKILGVSVKTVDQALAAEAAGADYLGAGAVYPTDTKSSGVIGLDGLEKICRAVSIPVVAIGGIQTHRIGDVLGRGADGVAVISAIFDRSDVQEAAEKLRRCVDERLP